MLLAPRPAAETTGRDLPQRTGLGRVMTDTTPTKKPDGLPPPRRCIHSTHLEVKSMSTISRRNMLTAAAMPALGVPAAALVATAAAPDQIFAALERHRAALDAY